MLKKTLLVSAFALGFSTIAFAGGLPEEPMAAPLATSDTGVYIGLIGGYVNTNWDNLKTTINPLNLGLKEINEGGFGGGAYIGYDFTKYLAAEFDYNYYFNKPKVSAFHNAAVLDIFEVKSEQAFGLFGKIKAPVYDNFDLYAKIGVGYLYSQVHALNPLFKDKDYGTFNVAFGVGGDYYITPNVIAGASWTRYCGQPKPGDIDVSNLLNSVPQEAVIGKYQPNADLFAIHLAYKFNI